MKLSKAAIALFALMIMSQDPILGFIILMFAFKPENDGQD